MWVQKLLSAWSRWICVEIELGFFSEESLNEYGSFLLSSGSM